jgi:serine/threonine protein kinase
MKKCDVFKQESLDPTQTFVSNKIRYVGKKNMRRHLLDKYVSQYASYGSNPHKPPIKASATEKHAHAFFSELLRTQIYLNRGIEQLIKANIVHNDIRYNNMVFDDKLEVPIFIDFGLSIDMRELSPETYTKRFYVFDIYPYWSMDVHICNYIFQVVTYPRAKTERIRTQDIAPLINSFIYKEKAEEKGTFSIGNEVFNLAIIQDQINGFKAKWTNYLKKFVNKTWFELYESCIKYFDTWDTYSVCVVYMMVMDDIFSNNKPLYNVLYTSYGSVLVEYIQIVSSVIYETSDKRPSLAKLNKTLKDIQKMM